MIRVAAVSRNPEIRYSRFLPCYLQSKFEDVFAVLTDTIRIACPGNFKTRYLFNLTGTFKIISPSPDYITPRSCRTDWRPVSNVYNIWNISYVKILIYIKFIIFSVWQQHNPVCFTPQRNRASRGQSRDLPI